MGGTPEKRPTVLRCDFTWMIFEQHWQTGKQFKLRMGVTDATARLDETWWVFFQDGRFANIIARAVPSLSLVSLVLIEYIAKCKHEPHHFRMRKKLQDSRSNAAPKLENDSAGIFLRFRMRRCQQSRLLAVHRPQLGKGDGIILFSQGCILLKIPPFFFSLSFFTFFLSFFISSILSFGHASGQIALTCDKMKAWNNDDMCSTEASLDCSAKPVMMTRTKSARWEEASNGTGWQAPPENQRQKERVKKSVPIYKQQFFSV